MTDPRAVYLKTKAETCELLGYDPNNLSVAEATKVGVVVSLKLALDDLQAKLLTGQCANGVGFQENPMAARRMHPMASHRAVSRVE